MEAALVAKKARAIGVSNFKSEQLATLLATAKVILWTAPSLIESLHLASLSDLSGVYGTAMNNRGIPREYSWRQCAGAACACMQVPPAVNQISLSVGKVDKPTVTFCKGKGIVVEAYSPLGHTGAPSPGR